MIVSVTALVVYDSACHTALQITRIMYTHITVIITNIVVPSR